MELTLKQARAKYPYVNFDGNHFYIGEGAVIREGADIWEGADIGEGAHIGEGAVIREGAYILVVYSKYDCHIIPYKDRVVIRIGCESHTIEEWEKLKEPLADQHDRKWWDGPGCRILEFLKGEVKAYLATKEGK